MRRSDRRERPRPRFGLKVVPGAGPKITWAFDATTTALAERYRAFLGQSERLASAWTAFASASPATRAELEHELCQAEAEVGGPALTELRQAASEAMQPGSKGPWPLLTLRGYVAAYARMGSLGNPWEQGDHPRDLDPLG